MNVYDSDRYDGYFYRNGCLIVLYGADKAKNVLDNTWIKKENMESQIREISI